MPGHDVQLLRDVVADDKKYLESTLCESRRKVKFLEAHASAQDEVTSTIDDELKKRQDEIKLLEDQVGEIGRIKGILLERSSENGNIQVRIKVLIERGDKLRNEARLGSGIQKDIKDTTEKLNELSKGGVCGVTPNAIEALAELKAGFERKNMEEVKFAAAGFEYLTAANRNMPGAAHLSRCLEIPGSDVKNCWVKSVVLMSRNRLAVCCLHHEEGGRRVHKIWLWKSVVTSTKPILLHHDYDATIEYQHMTKRGENELVILRKRTPILLIINVETRQTQKVKVQIPKDAIDELWQVDVDDSGNFVITYFDRKSLHYIAMVNGSGNVVHTLKVHCSELLTFCRSTRKIITCSFYSESIGVYEVNDTGLNRLVSSHHVDDLVCTDICSGS
jgi:hypothetical protein